MTLHQTPDDRDPGIELWKRILVRWRIRSGARQAAADATSGPEAAALCVAVVRSLEDPSQTPDLAMTARSWGAGVSSATEARSALLCLCEVTTELDGEVIDGFPPQGLDRVLEVLVTEAAAASTPSTELSSIDTLTGCPDRQAVSGDLDVVVASAVASGSDVAVAIAKLDESPKRIGDPHRLADDVAVLGLLATLRRAFGHSDGVYRTGDGKFAVLAPDTDASGAREVMLLATCAPGPRFEWGVASLHAAGTKATESPDLLLLLAEGDLYLRRKDFSRANAVLARRRRVSAVASIAAVTLLAGGIALGLETPSAVPGYQLHVAEHAQARGARPEPSGGSSIGSSSPPSSSPPPPSTPTSAPPSGARLASGIGSGPGSALTVTVPVVPAHLSLSPPQPVSVPTAPVPLAPAAPAPVAPAPMAGTTMLALHGHSTTSPGHTKIHGRSSKHA